MPLPRYLAAAAAEESREVHSLNKEEAYLIAKAYIENAHRIGESAGGSGHMGYTSLRGPTIERIRQCLVNGDARWEIAFRYTLVTETEFTCYPDNPPHERTHTKKLLVDEKGTVTEQPKRG